MSTEKGVLFKIVKIEFTYFNHNQLLLRHTIFSLYNFLNTIKDILMKFLRNK